MGLSATQLGFEDPKASSPEYTFASAQGSSMIRLSTQGRRAPGLTFGTSDVGLKGSYTRLTVGPWSDFWIPGLTSA